MTTAKRFKSLFGIIRAKIRVLKSLRWRSLFSRGLNENTRRLHVTEEFRAPGFPGRGALPGDVSEDTDQTNILPTRPLPGGRTVALQPQTEIDFQDLNDLEAFARGATVSKETIQKWVAAGILSPRETLAAEKLIKLMRKHAFPSADGNNGSPPS